jgi:hypothetical protein
LLGFFRRFFEETTILHWVLDIQSFPLFLHFDERRSGQTEVRNLFRPGNRRQNEERRKSSDEHKPMNLCHDDHLTAAQYKQNAYTTIIGESSCKSSSHHLRMDSINGIDQIPQGRIHAIGSGHDS